MKYLKLTIFVCCAALLFSCKKQVQNPVPLPENATKNKNELTDSLILISIFRNAIKGKDVNCDRNNGHFFADVALDSSTFSPKNWKNLDHKLGTSYFVEHIENIDEDSVKKKLVILSAHGESCHACPGVCGAAIFSLQGGKWTLEAFENDIAVLGTTGYPVDQVEIDPIGEGKYAIILKKGSIWQGIEERFFTLVLYEKGVFMEALDDTIGFSSNNWCNAEPDGYFTDAFSYTAPIFFDFQNTEPQFPDMMMHFQGTIPHIKTHKPVLLDQIIRFRFKDGKYMTKQKVPEAYR